MILAFKNGWKISFEEKNFFVNGSSSSITFIKPKEGEEELRGGVRVQQHLHHSGATCVAAAVLLLSVLAVSLGRLWTSICNAAPTTHLVSRLSAACTVSLVPTQGPIRPPKNTLAGPRNTLHYLPTLYLIVLYKYHHITYM